MPVSLSDEETYKACCLLQWLRPTRLPSQSYFMREFINFAHSYSHNFYCTKLNQKAKHFFNTKNSLGLYPRQHLAINY